MNIKNIPNDASSLLVPIHLDAWVVDSQNQEKLAWYYANYERLQQFRSPIPEAFDISDASKPAPGVHLHWALPDALTHGAVPPDGGAFQFPLVPNRWLVLRFNTPQPNGPWQCSLWVVASDYLGTSVGTTSQLLSGNNVVTIALQTSVDEAINEGAELQIIDPSGSNAALVIVATAANKGDTQVAIRPYDFSVLPLQAGSNIQRLASSAYLNPFQPTTMSADPGQTTLFNIQTVNIGKSYTIEAWQASTDADGELFLTAVGAGDIAFSGYVPAVKDVFSFTDTTVPPEETGVYTYTYMVVGWYSDPANADPLRGVANYIPGIWKTQNDWQNQTPAQRLQTLLTYLKWSVQGDVERAPVSSLYHGTVIDVQWPFTMSGNAKIDPNNVTVTVANTSTDALAALIQAQAQKNGWTTAGSTLASLVQAAMYDLLNDYGKPGGAALISQKIQQACFGADSGGTEWNVVASVPQAAGQSAVSAQLTPAQTAELNKQLAALNINQRAFEQAKQQLQSLQASLYLMWLKIGIGNSFGWGEEPTTIPDWSSVLFPIIEKQIYPTLFNQVWDQYCVVQQISTQLPDPANPVAANQWANQHWTFSNPGGPTTLAKLGLQLKATGAARFWHPNDPVVMVSGVNRSHKYGEDGRYNKDNTLTCRLPGQTIAGIQIPGLPAITVTSLLSAGVNLSPYGQYSSIPNISALLQEAFFVDPLNASMMAKAVGGNAATAMTINQAITLLLEQNASANSWIGTSPTPFALVAWEQAWSPLFLEWELNYFPTGAGSFSLSDWNFDGEKYSWRGTGFDSAYFVPYKGRTLFTPQAPLLFKNKILSYLKKHSEIDSQQLDELIATVSNWDILSQSLSGLTDQMITLLAQQTFPPSPLSSDTLVQCPRSGVTPPASALIGDQYHHLPILESSSSGANFYPVRGGFVKFKQLQVVDSFGQTFSLSQPNTPSKGFIPIIGQDLLPTNPPQNFPFGMVQLPPRIVQSARLDMQILANDGSGQGITVSSNPNPVCGWLLPNHLDGGMGVYDADGVLLGELLPLSAPYNWRPRPGASGNNPPPQHPGEITNATLQAVVNTIASQTPDVINDLLKVIDETLWMVDPLGGRKDQYLSVLIGRPLAVVQMSLQLNLLGNPVYNQLWNNMTVADPTQPLGYSWRRDIGEVENISFPICLGSLDLRNDGLIGYFLTQGGHPYSTFYSVHVPSEISSGDIFIRSILNNGQYQGDIAVNCNGNSLTVTLLMDPRGCVHAYTGILPVISAMLPANLVEDFIKQMKVTFQTGPIITDPGTLRIPKPAEQHGVWNWIQAVATPPGWEQDTIVNADDTARMPDAQLQLREGWLQLLDIQDDPSQLTLKKQVANPLLFYSLLTDPFPLQANLPTNNPIMTTLTVVATNTTNSDVTLQGIIVQIPVGVDATQLTDNAADIQPIAPSPWIYQSSQSLLGFVKFIFRPQPGSGTLAADHSLNFIFNNIATNTATGAVEIDITEGSNNCQPPNCPVYKLWVTKFPNGWGQVSFLVNHANVPYNGDVTLRWSGPSGATYAIQYYMPEKGIITVPLSNQGEYPGQEEPALLLQQTTVFTLNVEETIGGQSYSTQCQKTVTVEPPSPSIISFIGRITADKDGFLLMFQWQTQHADNCTLSAISGYLLQSNENEWYPSGGYRPASLHLNDKFILTAEKVGDFNNKVTATLTPIWSVVATQVVTQGTYGVSNATFCIAISQDGSRIFIPIEDNSSIPLLPLIGVCNQIFDHTLTLQMNTEIPGTIILGGIFGVAISLDSTRLYVLSNPFSIESDDNNGLTGIHVLDAATYAPIKGLYNIPYGDYGVPKGIAVSPDGSRLYVITTNYDYLGNDPPNNNINCIFVCGVTNDGNITLAVGSPMYVNASNGFLSVVYSVLAAPDGLHIYIGGSGIGKTVGAISVYKLTNDPNASAPLEFVANYPMPEIVTGLSTDGSFLYTAMGSSISIWDFNNLMKPLSSIPINNPNNTPVSLAVSSKGDYMYVVILGLATVQIIAPASLV